MQEFDTTAALKELQKDFGDSVVKSDIITFTHTDYYTKEMGTHLQRQWFLFARLIRPDMLVELKHKTNNIEKNFLNDKGGRQINIDPGLVSLSNIILASTKNYSHRIYLGNGIYGEVTLIYKNKTIYPLSWTYPDYRERIAIEFFSEARNILKQKLGELHLSPSREG